MILEFTVGGFKSFYKKQTFSFLGDGKHADDDGRVSVQGKNHILRACALFGPPGSGKSALLEAFMFFRAALIDGVSDGMRLEPNRFHSEPPETFFEIQLLYKKVVYRYGFTMNYGFIKQEWLYTRTGRREKRMYMRKEMQVKVGEDLSKHQLESLLAHEYLLFSFAYLIGLEWADPIAHVVYNISRTSLDDGGHVYIRNKKTGGVPQLLHERLGMSDEMEKLWKLMQIYYRKGDFFNKAKTLEEHGLLHQTLKSYLALHNKVETTLGRGDVLLIENLENYLPESVALGLMDIFSDPELNKDNAQLLLTTRHQDWMMNPRLLLRQRSIIQLRNYASEISPMRMSVNEYRN